MSEIRTVVVIQIFIRTQFISPNILLSYKTFSNITQLSFILFIIWRLLAIFFPKSACFVYRYGNMKSRPHRISGVCVTCDPQVVYKLMLHYTNVFIETSFYAITESIMFSGIFEGLYVRNEFLSWFTTKVYTFYQITLTWMQWHHTHSWAQGETTFL